MMASASIGDNKYKGGFGKIALVAKTPDLRGCCGNVIKFSYVISAPLHMKGFREFWANEENTGKIFVTFDLLIHLAVWITAIILEIWINAQESKGPAMLSELAMVSLWSLIVSLSGIFVAQCFAMWPGGQDIGKLYATTYGAIVGGAYTSIIMSILWAVQSVGWAAMAAQYSDDPELDDDLKSQRHAVLWAIALKICAVVTLEKNASFWGPCVIDDAKEIEEKNAPYKSQNGLMDA